MKGNRELQLSGHFKVGIKCHRRRIAIIRMSHHFMNSKRYNRLSVILHFVAILILTCLMDKTEKLCERRAWWSQLVLEKAVTWFSMILGTSITPNDNNLKLVPTRTPSPVLKEIGRTHTWGPLPSAEGGGIPSATSLVVHSQSEVCFRRASIAIFSLIVNGPTNVVTPVESPIVIVLKSPTRPSIESSAVFTRCFSLTNL